MKLRYITGRGGSATQGLSLYLSTLVNDYKALANDAVLHGLSVDEQINTVTEFCKTSHSENLSSHGTFQANELLANKIIRHLHILIAHLFIVIGNALVDELAPGELAVFRVFPRGDRLDEGISLRHVEERHR